MNAPKPRSSPSHPLLIRGGRVIEPASGHDGTADVLLVDGRVAAVGRIGRSESRKAEIVDAEGCLVTPGLIDIHVHFREPGQERKETIATGAAAAVAGGFTTVCCMPNTQPALDSPAALALVERKAREAGLARVFPVAAATLDRKGERPAPFGTLARAGAVGFTDDGDGIADPGVMERVLRGARSVDRVFMQHCQDPALSRGGVMNAGPLALRLGLKGWPNVAEATMLERDLRLNRSVGARYHAQHLSAAESVDLLRLAQAEGQPATGEVAPHHLLLTDEACDGYDTLAKMNPPLRTGADVKALKTGVADGTITVLATDHAPHTIEEKSLPFEEAPFGIVGLEPALALYRRALIDDGVLDWPAMIGMMTIHPARLVGLDARGLGMLRDGGPGDVTIIDPDLEWTVDANAFASKARNCPFDGWTLNGRAVATVVAGRIVHRHETALTRA